MSILTINEYLSIEDNQFYNDLYEGWSKFAPYFDFKLNEDDWYEIMSSLQDGTFEMWQREQCDTDFIVIVDDDCFFGISLTMDYTIPQINNILAENNINKQYTFNEKFNQIYEEVIPTDILKEFQTNLTNRIKNNMFCVKDISNIAIACGGDAETIMINALNDIIELIKTDNPTIDKEDAIEWIKNYLHK